MGLKTKVYFGYLPISFSRNTTIFDITPKLECSVSRENIKEEKRFALTPSLMD